VHRKAGIAIRNGAANIRATLECPQTLPSILAKISFAAQAALLLLASMASSVRHVAKKKAAPLPKSKATIPSVIIVQRKIFCPILSFFIQLPFKGRVA